MDLFVMQVLKMATHVTVEMLMTSLSQLTPENVTSHALAIKVNSVVAHGVCKYMIPNIQTVVEQCFHLDAVQMDQNQLLIIFILPSIIKLELLMLVSSKKGFIVF